MTTLEKNKLLADFEDREYQPIRDDNDFLWDSNDMPIDYSTDWESLHSVIEKLQTFKTDDDLICLSINNLLDTPIGNSIDAIFEKAVKVVLTINEAASK